MMGNGPEAKRPRLSEPSSHPPPLNSQWRTVPTDTSRELPRPSPHPPPSFNQHPSPYHRHEPHPHEPNPLDRRRSGQNEHPYENQDPRSRPPSNQRNEHPPYHPQELPRPHSGPAHGYNGHSHHGLPPPHPAPTYRDPGQRDPMVDVKRDPSDERDAPHIPFKPSPGHPQDRNVGPSPEERFRLPALNSNAHQQPHQANSMSPGPGPPTFRSGPSPYPPPQSPMPPPDYGPPQHHGANYGQPPTPGQQYGSLTANYPPPLGNTPAPLGGIPRGQEPRKKAQRAAQACDQCRALKGKCDEGRPKCGGCTERGTECHYRDPPPKQQDKSSADLLEGMNELKTLMTSMKSLDNVVTDLRAKNSALQDEVESLRALLSQAPVPLKQEIKHTPAVPIYQSSPSNAQRPSLLPSESSFDSTTAHIQAREAPEGFPDPGNAAGSDAHESTDGEDPPPPIAREPPKPSALPEGHTTGAILLLQVPSIRGMLSQKLARYMDKNPPDAVEVSRGILRVYGYGEGSGTVKEIELPNDYTPGDTASEGSSPACTGEEHGQVGGLTPPGGANLAADFSRGEINREGMPDFSEPKVNEYVESYKTSINNMHPILTPREISALVDRFLSHLRDIQARPKQVVNLASTTPFLGGMPKSSSPSSNKRKRSAGSDHPEVLISNTWDLPKAGHPFRSIDTCIVLLMLALGKIALHKERIPDVVPDKEQPEGASSSPRLSKATGNGLPPSPLQSQGSPIISSSTSPSDPALPRSRRASLEGSIKSIRSRPKNLDIIPGLAYFALATDIIGNQMGGKTLSHVHAYILSSLYYGQLARISESYTAIHLACNALGIALRPRLHRLRKIKRDQDENPSTAKPLAHRDNPHVFAFWTCLQLESDLIAEFDYEQSSILRLESDMPLPNFSAAQENDGFDEVILQSYSAQLYLRKHLNELHRMFYKPKWGESTADKGGFATIAASEQNLDTIVFFAPLMRWDLEEPQQSPILLHARLRAKFYGARVITYRQFILKIMAVSAERTQQVNTASAYDQSVKDPDVNQDAKTLDDLGSEVVGYAIKGLRALVHSTEAFHSVGNPGTERLIVTNVWGTAHAQWGNVITLSAAYKDPILKPLVEKYVGVEKLASLLGKTIDFLTLVATPTSALWNDLKVLNHVGHHIGLRPSAGTPQGPNTTSSFSSGTTGDVVMSGH